MWKGLFVLTPLFDARLERKLSSVSVLSKNDAILPIAAVPFSCFDKSPDCESDLSFEKPKYSTNFLREPEISVSMTVQSALSSSVLASAIFVSQKSVNSPFCTTFSNFSEASPTVGSATKVEIVILEDRDPDSEGPTLMIFAPKPNLALTGRSSH